MQHAAPLWPRQRATALALVALVVLQVTLFAAATAGSAFTHEDYYHFALAQERSLLHYLVTPIIHTYPAPGHRLLFFLLYEAAPMSYDAARAVLIGLLAGTTILLNHLVRTLGRSDHWWTVAVLTPFALSLTLVGPVNLWSNGVPVIPALFFTVVALSAWLRSYSGGSAPFWTGVAVAALAAAGTFYMKFVLLPLFLVFLRVAILPGLLRVPGGMRALWEERMRWVAVSVPPAVFLAVYVFSGLAGRSLGEGSRPYVEYLTTAWIGAVVPVTMLNVPLEPATAAGWWWTVVVCSHALFAGLVVLTWRRSVLALRAWALFGLVFVTNTVMVGAARLPGFGVEIAYWLRYYPEVVLFFPIVMALALRQGSERSPAVAWERTGWGRAAMATLAGVHVLAFAIWAPGIVAESDGARARPWIDNLRHDLGAMNAPLAVVDADTPEYIVLSWMEPYNRISTVLRLLRVEASYNDLSAPLHVVQPDGHLAEAVFRPAQEIVGVSLDAGGKRGMSEGWTESPGACLTAETPFLHRPEVELTGERLALRLSYSAASRQHARVEIETGDPERPVRHLLLRPFRGTAELIDLGTSRVLSLKVEAVPGDEVCIERMEIGSIGGQDRAGHTVLTVSLP